MTKETEMRHRRIFNVVLSAFLVLSGLLLMASCAYIYFGIGEYTREIVGKVFRYIALPVVFTLIMVLLSFVYDFVRPLKEKKSKPERDRDYHLKLLHSKKDLSSAEKSICEGIRSERRARVLWTVAVAALTVICAAAFLVYGLDPDNYHQSEINESMIGAMKMMAAPLVLSGAGGLFLQLFKKRSMEREAELLKKLPDVRGEGLVIKAESKAKKAVLLAVKIVIVLAGAALIVYGAMEGGFADVMTKAVNICTECIGLG